MKKPIVEVIRLNEDIIRTSSPCSVCAPDCVSVQTECMPICVQKQTDVCDCVSGDD